MSLKLRIYGRAAIYEYEPVTWWRALQLVRTEKQNFLPAATGKERRWQPQQHTGIPSEQWRIQESKPVGPASRSCGTKPYMLQ
jgi:hypothetical protein